MCISQKDLKDYQLIMAKMSKLDALSEQDKKFLYEHNLKQKYEAYSVVLDVVSKLNRSNVSS
jgi:hypothetical protein